MVVGTNDGGHNACQGTVTDNGSSAQIGPVTFTSKTDFSEGQTVGGFLVCGISNGSVCNDSYAPGAYALAAVDINDVALPNEDDSLTITYTFDISTPGA